MNRDDKEKKINEQLIRLVPNQDQQASSNMNNQKIQKLIKKEPKKEKKNVITSIQAQKRQGRYNIFIDEKYAFPVDEELIIRHMLHKGMVVTKEFQETLEEEDVSRKAFQRALNYLSYGMRSEKEVRDDLIEKEFEAYIDEVVEKLKDQRFIDDLEYAKSYVRTSANLNRKGPKVIMNELNRKGIDKLQTEEAMEEYSYEDQFDNAFNLAEKAWKKANQKSQREAIQKTKQFLLQKGYDMDIIQAVITELDTEKSEDEEYDSLVIQGERAWKRYAHKASGYELIRKTKTSLFQKGYPSDLIQRFIEQKEEEDEE
ncbi:recombination regulator RecX [Marinilactibacillus kalidii]|uniref:recombination regulator RecX n=1 Tax=Marinilactibacillus kalidii TaxID=2820274 RepID=UPI001ABE1B4C|nr:recombination regulator RecX [Marinilactibacillus kalidii]